MIQKSKCNSSLVRPAVRLFAASLLSAALLGTSDFGHAQRTTAIPARITQAVDETVLTTLKGNVPPLARPQFDKGPADPSLPAERMQLVLKRSPGQEFALKQLLGSLQDPSSSSYRKWLTPDQLGEQFGVSDADIKTVSDWLVSQGLKVTKVNKAKTLIEFSGTVGQLESAFHTQIHKFTVNGEQHLANVSDPRIPTALTPVVVGPSRLNSFFPKPAHHNAIPGRYDKAAGRLVPDVTIGTAPDYTFFMGPGDAATIYDTPNSLNANFGTGTAYTGSNVAIGIIGFSDVPASDIANYRSVFGLPTSAPTIVIDGADPGADNGDGQFESTLDLEASGALAPGAAQYFYLAADTNLDSGLGLEITRALDDNMVSIISVSAGECELEDGASGNEYFYGNWEQAAAQGISVVTSAGDAGSAGCDDFNSEEAAQYGLQVSGWASTPFNIAVGGTDYNALATDFTTYVSATNSKNALTSAKGYIPEEPWNNSTKTGGALSGNLPYMDSSGDTNIVAGSGGASSCVNPLFSVDGSTYTCEVNPANGVELGWPKPSWQTGGTLNIPADGVRDIPDVSLLASDGPQYGASWLICSSLVTGGNCATGADGEFGFVGGVGGTSASAPAFAGMLALISQSQGGSGSPVRLGQANYILYNLANQGSLYSTAFHDVKEGNNSVFCVSGSPDCGSNLFEAGYNADTGYDQASGLGSVDVTQLVGDWNKATFTSSTTAITINGGTAPISITHGQAVTLSATVTATSPTPLPSGDVAFLSNANQQADTYGANALFYDSLASGTTGPVTYSNLPGGTYSVSAYYGGDIDFLQSSSNSVEVTVAKEPSVLELTGQNGAGSVPISGSYPYGTYFSIDAQPVGASQVDSTNPGLATGSVVFTDTAGLPSGVSGTVAITSTGYAELPIYYWSTAPHSVGASYAGDNSFEASTASVAFTITPAPTANTVTSSASSVNGGTFTVTSVITPTPASAATPPTGIVTLTVGGSAIGSGPITPTTNSTTGAVLGTVTLTVNASSLAAGVNTITASYGGDPNYSASAGTVVVTSTNTPQIAVSAPALAPVSAGNSETITVSVTPSGGFTGAVNLTCSVTLAGAASPPTCSYNPASVTISGATAATSAFTVATTATTTVGSYAVGITATDAATGKITTSTGSILTVNAAGAPSTIALTPAPTAVTISSPGQSGTSTVSVTPSNYTGTLNLTCTLATAPSGTNATYNPTCSVPGTLPITATTVTTTNASFATTAPTSGALAYPETNRQPNRWYTAAGGAAMACVLFFGIPARRRGWKSMLSLLVFLVAMAGVGCGGGGGGNKGTPGTTVGSYTFTVTATDSKTATITAKGTVAVTVN